MPDPLRVLVVDDETALAGVVAGYLRREGFSVDLAHDGPAAVAAAREHKPDLVVLDVMLPGFDGIEVCRQLRGFTDAYIIMLTARDEEVDKVVGLSVGADDYLVKPFTPRELIARVRAMLRRPRTVSGSAAPDDADVAPLQLGELSIDTAARTVAELGDNRARYPHRDALAAATSAVARQPYTGAFHARPSALAAATPIRARIETKRTRWRASGPGARRRWAARAHQ